MQLAIAVTNQNSKARVSKSNSINFNFTSCLQNMYTVNW